MDLVAWLAKKLLGHAFIINVTTNKRNLDIDFKSIRRDSKSCSITNGKEIRVVRDSTLSYFSVVSYSQKACYLIILFIFRVIALLCAETYLISGQRI